MPVDVPTAFEARQRRHGFVEAAAKQEQKDL